MTEEDDRDETDSLASTVDQTDYGTAFEVERIIGEEVRRQDGITVWLVKWKYYPLHEASWEPQEHLEDSPEAMSEWLTLKIKIQNGEEVDRVQEWTDAKRDSLGAKWERHCQRNILRKQRGLQITEWPTSLQDEISHIEQWQSDNENKARLSSDEDLDFARFDDPTGGKQKGNKGKPPAAIAPSRSNHPQASQKAKAEVPKETASGQGSKITPDGQRLLGSPRHAPVAQPLAPVGKKAKEKPRNVATKSKPTPAVPNVFVGGKTRQKRTKSGAASGQGEDGRFLNLRNQNLLNKHSKNKENDAPRSMPKHLRSLNSQDPVPTKNEDAFVEACNVSTDGARPAQTPTDTDRPTPINERVPVPPKPGITIRSSMKTERATESPVTEAPKPEQLLKRKKSVRFDEKPAEDTGTSEPSLFVQDDDGPGLRSPSAVPQKLNERPKPAPSKSLPKPCLLGPEASTTITLFFHNVPRPEETWATDFERQQSLTFSHTCHAGDFIRQFVNQTQCVQKASGAVSAPTDSDLLDTVTDRLKLGSMGVWCQEESYCLLIYPFKSEDWEAADKIRTAGNEGALRYIIFGQAGFPRTHLLNDSKVSIDHQSFVGQNLDAFLNLDAGNRIYSPEHSKKAEKHEKHYVFLAFPPGAIEQARLMTQWIKAASKIECVVLDSNETSGDWKRFVQRGRGALIIHEDALRKTRLFPQMFEVLKRSTQGHIAVCMLDRALASSISATMWAKKNQTFGNIGLRKLASSGAVFMLTPSFIVSAPKGCRRFLEWFWSHCTSENKTLRRKLAVPAGVLEWMVELVLVKLDRRECSYSDEECWEKCIVILRELLRQCSKNDELGGFDIMDPLVTAPEKIDASDEQSLVNWFGVWTVSNLDEYCSFYVLGGGPFPGGTEPTIRLRPLRWEKDIVSSPDEALHLLHGGSSEQPAHTPVSHPKALQLISNDSAPSLRVFLQDRYAEVMKSFVPMFLYFKPVAYQDHEMAYHHGDLRSEASTYQKWFTSFYDLKNLMKKIRLPNIKHTLTGLFYTPEFEDEAPTRNRGKPALRPWIAMFRPCNPNQAPWTRTELFIWDQRYRGKFRSGQDLWESDLFPVHRAFIGHVGLQNNEKNRCFTLAKVWVGGWDDWKSPYDHPLDITLDRLCMYAVDLCRWVPDLESDIPQRGWTMIKADNDRPEPMVVDSNPPKNATLIDMADPGLGDEEEDVWDPDAKTVFHPPRGHNTREDSGSCWNRLHKTSRNPTLDKAGRFTFKYVPTMQWYGGQVRQGRQFEHIKVDTWQKVFEELDI